MSRHAGEFENLHSTFSVLVRLDLTQALQKMTLWDLEILTAMAPFVEDAHLNNDFHPLHALELEQSGAEDEEIFMHHLMRSDCRPLPPSSSVAVQYCQALDTVWCSYFGADPRVSLLPIHRRSGGRKVEGSLLWQVAATVEAEADDSSPPLASHGPGRAP